MAGCIHGARNRRNCKRCEERKELRYSSQIKTIQAVNIKRWTHNYTITMIILKCTCQYGMHALDYDEKTEKYLKELIIKNGQYKKVTKAETGKSYKVPVAYILAHGIKADELESYGFDEWKDAKLDTPIAKE